MTAPVQDEACTAAANNLSNTRETETRQAIAAVIETHRLGFLHLDAGQLASIWDRQHEPLVYVAQEREEPIFGWPGIQRYLAALPEHLEQVLSKELGDVLIDVLGDAAIASYTSRSSVKVKGRPAKYEPIGHVTMILRRTSEGWRVIHFHESARSAQAAELTQTMQANPRGGMQLYRIEASSLRGLRCRES